MEFGVGFPDCEFEDLDVEDVAHVDVVEVVESFCVSADVVEYLPTEKVVSVSVKGTSMAKRVITFLYVSDSRISSIAIPSAFGWVKASPPRTVTSKIHIMRE